MDAIKFTSQKKFWAKVGKLAFCFFIISVLSGCLENYGRLNRNPELQNAFETNRVPADYNYFFYGVRSRPYAVMGINSDYNLRSRIWRAVEPATEEFKHMTYWIWEDYGYYPYGAYILDSEGRRIGIWYSSVWFAAVKVEQGTKTIEVMPHIFLGGP
jgi:hypothetical protein